MAEGRLRPASADRSQLPGTPYLGRLVNNTLEWTRETQYPRMGVLTGTRHGDAANDLLAFYEDSVTELEAKGQHFMAAIAPVTE
jgi:hypothetical protein